MEKKKRERGMGRTNNIKQQGENDIPACLIERNSANLGICSFFFTNDLFSVFSM